MFTLDGRGNCREAHDGVIHGVVVSVMLETSCSGATALNTEGDVGKAITLCHEGVGKARWSVLWALSPKRNKLAF
jgi:hypothetical protein